MHAGSEFEPKVDAIQRHLRSWVDVSEVCFVVLKQPTSTSSPYILKFG